MATWLVVFLPASILHMAMRDFKNRTGHDLIVKGTDSLTFSPRFGVALKEVEVPGTSVNQPAVLIAKSVFVPLGVAQLFGLGGGAGQVEIDGGTFSYVIDADGRANLRNIDEPAKQKSDTAVNGPPPVRLSLHNVTALVKNLTTGSGFTLAQIDGEVTIDADQAVGFKASATVKDQRIHIDAHLKSVARALGEGSPLDLAIETSGANFEFTGRVVAGQKFGLAGQGSFDTVDARKALSWLGMDIQSLKPNLLLAVSGIVDSDDTTFTFKNVALQLDRMKAQGNVRYTLAGTRPALLLDLGIDRLDLGLLSQDTLTSTSWREQAFDLHDFKVVDAEFRLATNQVVYAPIVLGSSQISGSLKNGVFDARLEGTREGSGHFTFDAASQTPALKLDLALKDVEVQHFLARLMGMKWAMGTAQIATALTAQGVSPAALIGSLVGKGEIRVAQATLTGVDLAALAASLTQA
ncbi:MAG: hypothetical protein KGO94_05965, partial [Alphaproteobacteria bacterium]|nr:hypothetical protein [Alphaproteobacteria bacterium]